MLTISRIEQNPEEVIRLLQVKNYNAETSIERILFLDKERKQAQKENDDILAQLNALAKEIGLLFQKKEIEKANELKVINAELKEQSRLLSEKLEQIQTEITKLIVEIPNIPHKLVKPGKDETDNELIKQSAEIIDIDAIPHWEIATKANIIDFETGNKLTGAGFPVYRGKGAKLQRSLINYFLDQAVENGYTEIEPPLMVNEASAYATGQLPDKDSQMYFVTEDKFYLIPTAEVPLTNIYRDEIIDIGKLPVKLTAYSSCFRREAGSYGKNVRGLNRLHQFDKVEIVHIEHPGKSYETLEDMVLYVENILKSLGLVYRIIRLCGKDLSFTSAMTYDFEVYSFAQRKWLEVSSVSNFETFQSSRLKLRYRDENGKNQLAHTLNGSALALPRIVAALLENNQKDNCVIIPEVLQSYTGFDKIEF